MGTVAERNVTYEGIGFTLRNDRSILVHVPTGTQEFTITPELWRNVLNQMGLSPEGYFSGS